MSFSFGETDPSYGYYDGAEIPDRADNGEPHISGPEVQFSFVPKDYDDTDEPGHESATQPTDYDRPTEVSDRPATPSPELTLKEQLILPKSISRVAAGTVKIHTDVGAGIPYRLQGREVTRHHTGQVEFGDGEDGSSWCMPEPISIIEREAGQTLPPDMLECIAFLPAVRQVVRTREVDTPNRWRPGTHTEQQRFNTMAPVDPKLNPITGEIEPQLCFSYSFAPQRMHDYGQAPRYYESRGSRDANRLRIEVTLPQSMAGAMLEHIYALGDSTACRDYLQDVVHELAINNGGLPESAWNGSSTFGYSPIRPPFEAARGIPLYVLGPSRSNPGLLRIARRID
ncbi:MAG TPA: hypothetical protein VF809_03015 [Candidatus Saccharimonadales bacterium]